MVQVVAVLQFPLEDVRVEKDGAQRIVELVRHARSHLAHRSQLLAVDDMAVHVAQVAPRDVQLVAHPLRLVDDEGQAHGLLGHAGAHRRGFRPAGGVAAGPAVELVLREVLVRVSEDVADLFLGGLLRGLVVRGEGPGQIEVHMLRLIGG